MSVLQVPVLCSSTSKKAHRYAQPQVFDRETQLLNTRCAFRHCPRELGCPLGITVFLLPAKLISVKLSLKRHSHPCVLYSRSSLMQHGPGKFACGQRLRYFSGFPTCQSSIHYSKTCKSPLWTKRGHIIIFVQQIWTSSARPESSTFPWPGADPVSEWVAHWLHLQKSPGRIFIRLVQWEQSEVFLLLHCTMYCVTVMLSLIILVPGGLTEKENVTVPGTYLPWKAEEER